MIKPTRKTASLLAPFILSVGLTTACGTSGPAASDAKVTNGVVIGENVFPSAVLLVLHTPGGEGLCTGTFVNDSQVVTAAHCVDGLDQANPGVFYAKKLGAEPTLIAQAISFEANPRYSIEEGVGPYDLAVINFPAGTAPAVTPIASATPEVGTEFTIVGYGNNANFNNESGVLDGSGAGVKRHGSNVLSAMDNDMLAFGGLTGKESSGSTSRGKYVASGEGDSGGPMFVGKELVGVTSGGGLVKAEDGVTDVAVSFYVDLNNSVNRAFLDSVIED